MKTTYPIIISGTPGMIGEFQSCEYGRFEDWTRSKSDRTKEEHEKDFGTTLPAYEILCRHTSKIEIRDADELDEVYYSLVSGTFVHGDLDKELQKKNVAQARRWIEKLRPALEEENLIAKYKVYGLV